MFLSQFELTVLLKPKTEKNKLKKEQYSMTHDLYRQPNM